MSGDQLWKIISFFILTDQKNNFSRLENDKNFSRLRSNVAYAIQETTSPVVCSQYQDVVCTNLF